MEAALRRGDAAAAAAEFTPDAILLPAGMEPVRGREAIGALFAGIISAMRPSDFRISTEEVEVRGDLAYERGTNAIPHPGGVQRGRYIVIW